MKQIIVALAIGLNILSANAQTEDSQISGNCQHTTSEFRCVGYQGNYDGDTVTFNIPKVHPLLGEQISIRVEGVDAPEMKSDNECEKEKAKEARDLVKQMLKKAGRIDLVEIHRDKYFRVLADIHADGRSVRDVLLREGLAVPYDGGHKNDVNWCRK